MLEKDHLFDIRIIERNYKRGTITEKEYLEFLKNLPDEAEKAEEVEMEVEEGEFTVDFPEPEE